MGDNLSNTILSHVCNKTLDIIRLHVSPITRPPLIFAFFSPTNLPNSDALSLHFLRNFASCSVNAFSSSLNSSESSSNKASSIIARGFYKVVVAF